MNAPHTQQPATLLLNGQVLVTGTLTCNPKCYSGSTTELYDPVSNAWTVTAAPQWPRFNHIQERLPNGKVLVAGGYWEPGIVLNNAEIYDPTVGTWTSTGSFLDPRQFHQSTVLLDGRVLIVGGLGTNFEPLSSAEMYDPQTGGWSFAGSMSVARFAHSTTALHDGRVLVAGGTSANGQSDPPLQSAELYDPITNSWSSAASMSFAREGHSAVLLPNGQVLVTGGYGESGKLAGAELYDPTADRWTATGSMSVPRGDHSLTVLPNGRVLAAGGNDSASVLNSTEIYDPDTGTWFAAADLQQARESQSATLLASGKVLVAGGDNRNAADVKGLANAELFGTAATPVKGLTIVSAASYFDNGGVAPDSIASAFGSFPSAAGIGLTVKDGGGTVRQAKLLSISTQQINYLVPSGTAPGMATVTVSQAGNIIASGQVLIETVAPGVFAADSSGQGLAAALALRIHADGTQSYEPVEQFDPARKTFAALPIDLSSKTDRVFLLLFGTGIRSWSSLTAVRATIGSALITATFAGASPQFAGVDQVNLPLPSTLAGSGDVGVVLSVDGFIGNTVLVGIK